MATQSVDSTSEGEEMSESGSAHLLMEGRR